MNPSSDQLQVTPHVVRFRGSIYQISNICSVGATRHKATFKDILMIVLSFLGGVSFSAVIKPLGPILALLGLSLLIRLAILTSRTYLHLEMSSGASDLFHSNNHRFMTNVVLAIESSMRTKSGPSYTYNVRNGQVVNVETINNAGAIGNIGNGNAIYHNMHPQHYGATTTSA